MPIIRDAKGRFAKSTSVPAIKKKPRAIQPIFCLDASGSMTNLAPRVVDAYNSMMKSTRDNARLNEQAVLQPIIIRFGVPPECFGGGQISEDKVSPDYVLTEHLCYGNTPLYDAVLRGLSNVPADNIATIMFVLTDGQENSSQSSIFQVISRLKTANESTRFTAVFAGPPGSKYVATAMGFHEGNIQEWNTTERGLVNLTQKTVQALGEFYTTGGMSTNCFYSGGK